MQQLIREQIVFNNHLTIQEGEFTNGMETYSRMRLNRPDASAVLVYNTESSRFILTKQFRYAISARDKENILEIVAGKVDAGENPEQAAIRECREEVGYSIRPGKIQLIGSCFASPGYTSELLHLYYAEVINGDLVSEGGGLKEEQEEISLVEIERESFLRQIRNMELTDAKSLLAGLWLITSGKAANL